MATAPACSRGPNSCANLTINVRYSSRWYCTGGGQTAVFRVDISQSHYSLRITNILFDTTEWTPRHFHEDELTSAQLRQESMLQELCRQLKQHPVSKVYGDSEERENA